MAAALACALLPALHTPAQAAEYDWAPAGRISEARTSAATAVLNDGRVLLAGGGGAAGAA